MIIKGLNIKGVNISTFDDDALAFLSSAGITDSNQRNAVNNLVVQMKKIGVWNKMIYAYPMVGGTSDTHKYNLLDPQDTNGAYRLTWLGGWTHDSRGATGNGTNAYAFTQYTVTSSRRDDMSLGYFTTDCPYDGGGANTGWGIDGVYLRLFFRATQDFVAGNVCAVNPITNTSPPFLRQPSKRGVVSFTKDASGIVSSVITNNGVQEDIILSQATFPSSDPQKCTMQLNCERAETNPNYRNFSPNSCGFAYFGTALTKKELSKFNEVIDGYNKQLGR